MTAKLYGHGFPKTKSLRNGMLATLAGFVGVASSLAADTLTNLTYDAVWKYNKSGDNLGTAWRDTGYDDTAWPSGRGVFSYDSSSGNPLGELLPPVAVAQGAVNRTPLALYNEGGSYIPTFYFRTRLTLALPLAWIVMTFSNVLDDGAVFYLNGQEIHRENMPDGSVFYETMARNFVEASTYGVAEFTVVPDNLREGENVLAVEVHQVTLSSDVVFGLSLSVVAGLPQILTQPASVTVEERKPFTLAVDATGYALEYQWQKADGTGAFTNVPGAVSRAFSRGGQFSDAGDYRVLVSNLVTSVTSAVARVVVLPDPTGPAVLSAVASANGTAYVIAVRFSELVDLPSVRQLTNYTLRELESGSVVPFSVYGFPQEATVKLQSSAMDPSTRYVLTVNQVKNRAGKVIAPGTQVPVWFTTDQVRVPMDQVWRWNEDDTPLPPAWRTNHLENTRFGEALGAFYSTIDPVDFCRGAKNTSISLGPRTYYFTTWFASAFAMPETSVRLVHLVDDGAVFHLNGVEISRFNMPAGAIDHLTASASPVDLAVCMTNTATVINLVAGMNILALEVHQAASSYYSDVVFGLEVRANLPEPWSLPPSPVPTLAIQRQDNQVALSWNGGGWALEWAESVTGPWLEVQPNMTNPYVTTLADSIHRFWRLCQKQF